MARYVLVNIVFSGNIIVLCVIFYMTIHVNFTVITYLSLLPPLDYILCEDKGQVCLVYELFLTYSAVLSSC
jgi:hypothetical protein